MGKLDKVTALEKNAWFYLANNSCMAMVYNLRRINETCKEHIENNFRPLPSNFTNEYYDIQSVVSELFTSALKCIENGNEGEMRALRRRCDTVKDNISAANHRLYDTIRNDRSGNMTVLYVYLNSLQETQEMVSNLRKFLRALIKLMCTATVA